MRDAVLRSVEAVARTLKEPVRGTDPLAGDMPPLRGLDEDDVHGPAPPTDSSHLPLHHWKPTGEAFNHLLGFYGRYVEAVAANLDGETAAHYLKGEIENWQSDAFRRRWPFTHGLRELESMILDMLGAKLTEVEAASPSRAVVRGATAGDRKSGSQSEVGIADTESDSPPRFETAVPVAAPAVAAGAGAIDVQALCDALAKTDPRLQDLDGALLGATAFAVKSARLDADSALMSQFTAFVNTHAKHLNPGQVRSLFLGMGQALGGAAMSESDLRVMLAFPFEHRPTLEQHLGMLDGLIQAAGGTRLPERLDQLIADALPAGTVLASLPHRRYSQR